MNKVFSYFKESKDELTKVVWPTRKQVIAITLAVIILVVFVSVLLGFFDYLLQQALSLFLSIKK